MNVLQANCHTVDSSHYCDCFWCGQCYVAFTTVGVCPVLLMYTHLRQFSRPALDRTPKAARCFWLLLLCSSLSAFIWRRENNNNNKIVNNGRDVSRFISSDLRFGMGTFSWCHGDSSTPLWNRSASHPVSTCRVRLNYSMNKLSVIC